MKKIILMCFVNITFLSSYMLLNAKEYNLSFLTNDLESFIRCMTDDTQEQRAFIRFYNTINKKMWDNSQEVRKQGQYHFIETALQRLPEEHPTWYTEIKPFITNPNAILDPAFNQARKAIRFFLTCYGTWHEFNKRLHPEKMMQTVVIKSKKEAPHTWWQVAKSSTTSCIAYVGDTAKQGYRYIRSKIVA